MANAKGLKTDCVTPRGRVSYPSLFEPKEQMDPSKLKYELTLLFDKKTTSLAELRQMLDNAATNKWGADKKKWPKFAHPAIKDGDEKGDQEAYHGCWYITPKANEDRRPQVLNLNKSPISKEDGDFYAGCYARAYVNAYAYGGVGKNGKHMQPGVTFGLNAVQKVGDGDRFDNRRDASEMFDEIESGEEDAANYREDESDSAFQ